MNVNQKRARFLLKVFIVRHVIGVGLLLFLTISALRLKMNDLGLGAAGLTLAYAGVAIWMGRRIMKSGRPK